VFFAVGRQSFTDKAGAALKPDSEKSTTEHLGDKFKGNMDSAGSTMQPQSEKSTTQKVGDTFSSNSNNNDVRTSSNLIPSSVLTIAQESLMQKAKNAMGLGNH
jgi:hypothetical protein